MPYSFRDAYASVQTAESSVVSGSAQRQVVAIGSVLQIIPVTLSGASSVSGTVGASIIGLTPVAVTNIPSISGQVGASVVGTVPVTQAGAWSASLVGTIPGSVVSFQGGAWSASLVGTIPGSVVAFVSGLQGASVSGQVGASLIGLSPVSVSNFPTTQNVSGSVVAFGFPTTQNVSGSVVAFVSGTVPVNTAGSVVAFQGTSPWVVQSIVGTYAEDATHTSADKGIFTLGVRNDAVASFAGANLEYGPIGTDSAGRNLTKPFAPEESRIEGYISLTSASITTMVAAAGAGLRNYITDVWVANTGASTTLVTFNDGAGSVLGFTIAPAGGGSNLVNLATPMRTGANATFDIKPATPTSTFYATAKGFKAP